MINAQCERLPRKTKRAWIVLLTASRCTTRKEQHLKRHKRITSILKRIIAIDRDDAELDPTPKARKRAEPANEVKSEHEANANNVTPAKWQDRDRAEILVTSTLPLKRSLTAEIITQVELEQLCRVLHLVSTSSVEQESSDDDSVTGSGGGPSKLSSPTEGQNEKGGPQREVPQGQWLRAIIDRYSASTERLISSHPSLL